MASGLKSPPCGSPTLESLFSAPSTSKGEDQVAGRSEPKSVSCSTGSGAGLRTITSCTSINKSKKVKSVVVDSSGARPKSAEKIKARRTHPQKSIKASSSKDHHGEKRKSHPQPDLAQMKKRKSGDVYENKALKEFGHLVRTENSKKRIKHVLGPVSIPSEPNGDSEFEDELFIKEDKSEIWSIYRGLVKTILQRSKLNEAQKDRLRVFMFDVFAEVDCPMLCPVRGCNRTKLLFSRLAFLRHVTESHLPESPWWRCPSAECEGKQPRKIALVRHLGWFHKRSNTLAVAITLKEDKLIFEDNPTFKAAFEIMGRKAPEFYSKIGEEDPNVPTKVAPLEEVEDLAEEPDCELLEELVGLVSVEVSGDEKEDTAVDEFAVEDSVKTVPLEAEQDETTQATNTLVGLMQAAEAAGPSVPDPHPPSEPKRIPDLFLFDDNHPPSYIDKDIEGVEMLTLRLRRLTTISQEQATLCQGMTGEMDKIRRMADIHEGSLRLTCEQTQEVIDSRRKLFHQHQINGELARERDALAAENMTLKEQLKSRGRAVALLEGHVRDLQADVKRHQQELMEAEVLVKEAKAQEPLLDLAGRVAEILKKGGL